MISGSTKRYSAWLWIKLNFGSPAGTTRGPEMLKYFIIQAAYSWDEIRVLLYSTHCFSPNSKLFHMTQYPIDN
jgi:hypothetical protein